MTLSYLILTVLFCVLTSQDKDRSTGFRHPSFKVSFKKENIFEYYPGNRPRGKRAGMAKRRMAGKGLR